MPGRTEAKAVIRADNRRLGGDLAKSRRMFGKAFGRIGRGLTSALSIGGGGGLAILGGVVARDVLSFEDKLNRVQIQAGASKETIDDFRRTVVGMSKATGISRNELLAATESLVNLTGAAGFSAEKLAVLAEANLATGATMEDLAGLAFSLENAFGITSAEDLTKGLSGIVEAGKRGAVPLNQMSMILQQVSSEFKDVASFGPEGAAELGAALQIARRGFGTAEMAGTGLSSLLGALIKNAGKLKKSGIDVFKDDGTFNSLTAILDQFDQSKIIKDPTLLIKALGRKEAFKTLKVFQENRQALDDITEAAKGSDAIQTDAEARRQSSAFKIQQSMTQAKEEIAEAFTTENIKAFGDALGFVVEAMKNVIDGFRQLVDFGDKFLGGPLGEFIERTYGGGATDRAKNVFALDRSQELLGEGTIGKRGGINEKDRISAASNLRTIAKGDGLVQDGKLNLRNVFAAATGQDAKSRQAELFARGSLKNEDAERLTRAIIEAFRRNEIKVTIDNNAPGTLVQTEAKSRRSPAQ